MESGVRQLTEQDLNTVSTTKQVEYGAMGSTPDGRKFRYVGFGGTSTIAPGQLLVAKAYTAAFDGLAIPAALTGTQTAASLKAGSTFLCVTNGATVITQDEFAEGYLEVLQTSGSNNGPIVYQIRGNDAAAASANFNVYLRQEEPLRNATTLTGGTDTVNLQLSPYSTVAASGTAGTSIGVNVLQVVNTASVTNYGWVQTYGLVDLTNDAGGTITVGEGVAQSTTTAGDIVAVAATTFQIGQARLAISASTAGPVWLTID